MLLHASGSFTAAQTQISSEHTKRNDFNNNKNERTRGDQQEAQSSLPRAAAKDGHGCLGKE